MAILSSSKETAIGATMNSLAKSISDIHAAWQPGEECQRMWTPRFYGAMDTCTFLRETFSSGMIVANGKSKMGIHEK